LTPHSPPQIFLTRCYFCRVSELCPLFFAVVRGILDQTPFFFSLFPSYLTSGLLRAVHSGLLIESLSFPFPVTRQAYWGVVPPSFQFFSNLPSGKGGPLSRGHPPELALFPSFFFFRFGINVVFRLSLSCLPEDTSALFSSLVFAFFLSGFLKIPTSPNPVFPHQRCLPSPLFSLFSLVSESSHDGSVPYMVSPSLIRCRAVLGTQVTGPFSYPFSPWSRAVTEPTLFFRFVDLFFLSPLVYFLVTYERVAPFYTISPWSTAP